MDPNEALKQIRRLTKKILDGVGEPTLGDAERLAELVEGLDEWISRGGFLPKGWTRR